MSERNTSPPLGMIFICAIIIGAALGLSTAMSITDHFELRDLQRRVGQLEQSK